MSALQKALETGLQQLDLSLSAAQIQSLMDYLALLSRWNKAYNLTAVRDPADMVVRHLLDSLAIARLLPESAKRLVDVGTGAGLPGVPLAILCPEPHFELLDSNGKKTRFLFQVKTDLGLANMAVRHVRAEAWNPGEPYDVVLSRAFTSLPDMVEKCVHLCRPGGVMLAMKGQSPDAEIAALNDDRVALRTLHRVEVPGLEEERHLVELEVLPSASQAMSR